jgi:TyrR family helix-turn-helix protein
MCIETGLITSLLHNPDAGLDDLLAYFEKEVLTHFMNQLHSSRKVAERLRVSQSTIVRKMQKYKELK